MRQHQRLITVICAVMLLAAFLLTGLATWRASSLLLDGDTSSEMVLAKLLHDEGGIFSSNWHYSTEIRVISTKLTTAPLFSLFSDWTTVRFVSMMLWHVLLLVSWFFLGKELNCSMTRILLGGTLLMLPFSVCYGRMVLFQGYYAPHITVEFTLAALYLHALKKTGRRQLPALVLLLIAAFAAGCCGIRHLMCLAAPLGITFLWCLADHLHAGHEKLTSLRKSCPQLMPMIILCIGCLAGFAVYTMVLQPRYSSERDYAGRALKLAASGDLWPILTGWLADLGYVENEKLFSVDGIAGLLCGVAAIALPIIAAGNSRDREETQAKRFASRMFLCGIAVMALVFTLVSSDDDYYPLYWLIPAVWAVPMLMTRGKPFEGTPCLRSLISGTCAATLLLSGLVTLPFFIYPGTDDSRVYEGLEYQNTHLTEQLQGTVDFLESNGYDLGLGMTANAHWYTHVITEMTDGRISMAICNNGIDRFLNDKRILTSPDELTQHKFFAIVENASASEEFSGSPYAENANIVYQDNWFTVLTWDDPAAVFGSICKAE